MPEPGLARSPAVELVMMMEPLIPPARRAGSATEIVFQVPVRFVSMMSPHTAAGSPPSCMFRLSTDGPSVRCRTPMWCGVPM